MMELLLLLSYWFFSGYRIIIQSHSYADDSLSLIHIWKFHFEQNQHELE